MRLCQLVNSGSEIVEGKRVGLCTRFINRSIDDWYVEWRLILMVEWIDKLMLAKHALTFYMYSRYTFT